jgi:hypothetical protein
MDMDMAGGFAAGTAPCSAHVCIGGPIDKRPCGVLLRQAAERRGQLARVGWVGCLQRCKKTRWGTSDGTRLRAGTGDGTS